MVVMISRSLLTGFTSPLKLHSISKLPSSLQNFKSIRFCFAKRFKTKKNAREFLDSFFLDSPKALEEAYALTHCTRRINQKYVSDIDLPKRVSLIRSEPGSGKSTLTKRFIQNFPVRFARRKLTTSNISFGVLSDF